MVEQFKLVLASSDDSGSVPPAWHRYGSPRPEVQKEAIASSIGGFLRPNRWEATAVERLLSDPPPLPLQRSLPRDAHERAILILSSIPTPAATDPTSKYVRSDVPCRGPTWVPYSLRSAF